MKIRIKDLDINYIQYGEGKDIVLLHGWGQNIAMMKPLGDFFSDDYRITILDLPGFGESDEPTTAFSVKDYALVLEALLTKLDVKKPIVMGHSFGGRVAIRFGADNPIEKLVLFGSPCIRDDEKLPFSIKLLKKLKQLPGLNGIGEYMKKYIGSRDYKAASPMMRKILVNTVNEDLSNYAVKIEEPTLLIWGDHDEEASIEDAKRLEALMPDAALITLPGTHYAYLENLNRVVSILKSFI